MSKQIMNDRIHLTHYLPFNIQAIFMRYNSVHITEEHIQ